MDSKMNWGHPRRYISPDNLTVSCVSHCKTMHSCVLVSDPFFVRGDGSPTGDEVFFIFIFLEIFAGCFGGCVSGESQQPGVFNPGCEDLLVDTNASCD